MSFVKAEKRKLKLRMAIDGPSGSGKTFSALKIASGMSGKIAMIDTEHASSAAYAGIFDYDICELDPPYTPERYIEAINDAAKGDYDILIIDSISHAWSGKGGVLDMKDNVAKGMKGNSFSAWRYVSPKHNALVEAFLSFPGHLIATMRTKTHWDFEDDGKGRKKPVKIGLKPEQKEGVEYEFTLVLDMSIDGHVASVSKDRTGVLDGKFFTPDESTGKELLEWLDTGIDPPKRPDPPKSQPKHNTDEPKPGELPTEVTDKELKNLWDVWKNLGGHAEEWKKNLKAIGITKGHATQEQLDNLSITIDALFNYVKEKDNAESDVPV